MSARTETTTAAPAGWDAFVEAHPAASLYHTSRWVDAAASAFGFEAQYLVARGATGAITAALPLIVQRSLVFGRRAVSLPFFNYGGILGAADGATALIAEARRLARANRWRDVELRDTTERAGLATRTDKVTMLLPLPATPEQLGRQLGAKLRSQIRRCDREEPRVRTGGAELVADFYSVFAATMRDLGTPVYPRRFFEHLAARVGMDCTLVCVDLHERPAAAAWLTHWRGATEIPWAASLHELRATAVNMRLYWECLTRAIARGSRQFDFGRSTVDTGTYRFKAQWGAEPRQLYWHYPLVASLAAGGDGSARALATLMWSKLPRAVASRLGPWVSPGLPW